MTLHLLVRHLFNKVLFRVFVERREYIYMYVFCVFTFVCISDTMLLCQLHNRSLAVSQVTSAAPTSLSVSASNTMAPGPSNSIHPVTSPGASASGGGGGNGTSSGPTNSKPAPSVSPSGNVMSEGTHILSGGSAVVFLISTVLYFIL